MGLIVWVKVKGGLALAPESEKEEAERRFHDEKHPQQAANDPNYLGGHAGDVFSRVSGRPDCVKPFRPNKKVAIPTMIPSMGVPEEYSSDIEPPA
ncbi:hypothetical protein [Blastopirellula retiformator]|uniref:hypothetical protein n=1 Tax=Blastopirellula retiformator TaxID=2527970 RepID=UPI0011B7F85A|nr:hypothetical protein [Blastopirellula retiformator]